MRRPDIDRLRGLIARLRGPDGCPWDREQTLGSVRAYLLEEAHEAAAALDDISSDEGVALRGELGDLLFQVTFVASLAEDERLFSLADVIDEVHQKMIDRHPHVFGEESIETAEEVAKVWEQRKQREPDRRSALDGVPTSLPSLLGAYRIGQKAAGLGFDWNDRSGVVAKVHEELGELEEQLEAEDGPEVDAAREEEIGDLFFALANLARHLKIDPEQALAKANSKFRRRFADVETQVDGRWNEVDLAALEEFWKAAKSREK
ncbi:MAG: nucleoside triphosphate pyrophosphohydrolase [Acidobacteriota bacterium]